MEYTLIGHPVVGSLSPKIHNTAFAHFRLPHRYTLSDTKLQELPQKIAQIRHGVISGANVTIPYKCEVLKYVDDICDVAKKCQAVNTLYMKEDRLYGTSTDGRGALRALEEAGIELDNKVVVILGTGGAAKAVASALTTYTTTNVSIVGRDEGKISRIVEITGGTGFHFDEEKSKNKIRAANVIINATSVGMLPFADESPLSENTLHSEQVVFDLVYKPLKTKLLRIAESKGATVVNGLGMLIYQAIYAFELWTGQSPPVSIIQEAINVQE